MHAHSKRHSHRSSFDQKETAVANLLPPRQHAAEHGGQHIQRVKLRCKCFRARTQRAFMIVYLYTDDITFSHITHITTYCRSNVACACTCTYNFVANFSYKHQHIWMMLKIEKQRRDVVKSRVYISVDVENAFTIRRLCKTKN